MKKIILPLSQNSKHILRKILNNKFNPHNIKLFQGFNLNLGLKFTQKMAKNCSNYFVKALTSLALLDILLFSQISISFASGTINDNYYNPQSWLLRPDISQNYIPNINKLKEIIIKSSEKKCEAENMTESIKGDDYRYFLGYNIEEKDNGEQACLIEEEEDDKKYFQYVDYDNIKERGNVFMRIYLSVTDRINNEAKTNQITNENLNRRYGAFYPIDINISNDELFFNKDKMIVLKSIDNQKKILFKDDEETSLCIFNSLPNEFNTNKYDGAPIDIDCKKEEDKYDRIANYRIELDGYYYVTEDKYGSGISPIDSRDIYVCEPEQECTQIDSFYRYSDFIIGDFNGDEKNDLLNFLAKQDYTYNSTLWSKFAFGDGSENDFDWIKSINQHFIYYESSSKEFASKEAESKNIINPEYHRNEVVKYFKNLDGNEDEFTPNVYTNPESGQCICKDSDGDKIDKIFGDHLRHEDTHDGGASNSAICEITASGCYHRPRFDGIWNTIAGNFDGKDGDEFIATANKSCYFYHNSIDVKADDRENVWDGKECDLDSSSNWNGHLLFTYQETVDTEESSIYRNDKFKTSYINDYYISNNHAGTIHLSHEFEILGKGEFSIKNKDDILAYEKNNNKLYFFSYDEDIKGMIAIGGNSGNTRHKTDNSYHIGDFDDDGYDDILVIDEENGLKEYRLYINRRTDNSDYIEFNNLFADRPIESRSLNANTKINIGDFNNDNKMDILTYSTNPSEPLQTLEYDDISNHAISPPIFIAGEAIQREESESQKLTDYNNIIRNFKTLDLGLRTSETFNELDEGKFLILHSLCKTNNIKTEFFCTKNEETQKCDEDEYNETEETKRFISNTIKHPSISNQTAYIQKVNYDYNKEKHHLRVCLRKGNGEFKRIYQRLYCGQREDMALYGFGEDDFNKNGRIYSVNEEDIMNDICYNLYIDADDECEAGDQFTNQNSIYRYLATEEHDDGKTADMISNITGRKMEGMNHPCSDKMCLIFKSTNENIRAAKNKGELTSISNCKTRLDDQELYDRINLNWFKTPLFHKEELLINKKNSCSGSISIKLQPSQDNGQFRWGLDDDDTEECKLTDKTNNPLKRNLTIIEENNQKNSTNEEANLLNPTLGYSPDIFLNKEWLKNQEKQLCRNEDDKEKINFDDICDRNNFPRNYRDDEQDDDDGVKVKQNYCELRYVEQICGKNLNFSSFEERVTNSQYMQDDDNFNPDKGDLDLEYLASLLLYEKIKEYNNENTQTINLKKTKNNGDYGLKDDIYLDGSSGAKFYKYNKNIEITPFIVPRIQIYGKYICTFLDIYDPNNIYQKKYRYEYLSRDNQDDAIILLDGRSYNIVKNSRRLSDDDKWKTIRLQNPKQPHSTAIRGADFIVPYIAQTYTNKEGKIFKKSLCAKIPIRRGYKTQYPNIKYRDKSNNWVNINQ